MIFWFWTNNLICQPNNLWIAGSASWNERMYSCKGSNADAKRLEIFFVLQTVFLLIDAFLSLPSAINCFLLMIYVCILSICLTASVEHNSFSFFLFFSNKKSFSSYLLKKSKQNWVGTSMFCSVCIAMLLIVNVVHC